MEKKKRKSPRHRARRWRLCVIGCLILLLSARLALFGVKKVENTLYPIKYSEFVEYYADKYELDPLLVYAIIRTESGFDPAAHSNADAIGLMQITETAFHWLRAKIAPGEELTFESLYDPETNIRYGTWYLGYLSRRFDGDATKIVCAYHAGQGNVDSWLKNPQYSSDGVTLDVIPTQDTATYASRVLRARDIYRKYYFPIELPDTQQTETES